MKFAVARIIGQEPIASDVTAPIEAEERLSRQATWLNDPLAAVANAHNSGSIQFYAALRLIDSTGRFRGTLGIGDDRPHETGHIPKEEMFISASRQLTGLLEIVDTVEKAKTECDQFRSLVEDSAAAIYSIHNGRFSYVNTKFAESLGFTKDEILAFDSFLHIIPKEEREVVQEMTRQRHSGEVQDVSYVTTVQRRDGTLLDAEIHGSSTDLDGERLIIGTAVDVTARRSANRLLREREEYFRALTENVADVICIASADHVLTYTNSSIARILGYKVEERLGRKAFETAHADDRERLWSALDALAPGQLLEPCEVRFRHKNGSWRLLEVSGTNLLHHPQICGFVITASDVTDGRRMEQELEQLNRLTSLGRLSAQVAHEFNNVLMGMQPAVDVIRRRTTDDPQMARLTDMIAVSITRGKRITSDILRFGRPAQLSLRSVDVQELLNRIGDEVRPLLREETKLQLEVPSSPLHVHADSAQLSQVLMNLTLNARDAMSGAEGTLTIGARPGSEHTAKSIGDIPKSDQFIHFNVTDTGEGIRAEDLPYIFEPLFTTKKTGTGLGLSVVYQVVTAHGGHVFVETERHQGTTFHLFIPAAEPRVTLPLETTELRSADRTKLRILIVEDDVTIATGLRWALEAEGMVVHTVARAADAMPAVEGFKPDVVVLDLSLPDADGRTVYQALAPRQLPVIFSTGSVGERELIDDAPANVAVLLKPYTSDDLVRAIHKVIPQ